MYIRKLSIKNLKLLRDFELDFTNPDGSPRMWTVLLGENGSCKTALLQAIALAASGPAHATPLTSAVPLRTIGHAKEDMEIIAHFTFAEGSHAQREYPGLKKSSEPPKLRSRLVLKPGRNVFEGKSGYTGEGKRGVDPLYEARSRELAHWFVAGYGVNRVLPATVLGQLPNQEDPVLWRLGPLFDKSRLLATGFYERLTQFSKGSATAQHLARDYWFRFTNALIQGNPTYHKGLLPLVSNASFEVPKEESRMSQPGDHWFVYEAGPRKLSIPATQLSQGYQSVAAWITDLIGHQFLDAGRALKYEEMEGLVLVDELDLHLHPMWQATLVESLKRTFPRIQFVASTHSPMVLAGLRQDEVRILRLDDQGDIRVEEAPRSPMLMTGSGLYEAFFGIDKLYPNELGEALRRYGYLVGNPRRTKKEEAEMQRLQATLEQAGVAPDWTPVPRQKS